MEEMEMHCTSLKKAKNYYKRLANDFCMKKWVFEKIENATSMQDLERIWWGALNTI